MNTRNYIRKILNESINRFNPIESLKRVARFCDTFEQFAKHYTQNINHGYFWHFTTNPDFTISSDIAPRDMSSLASGVELEEDKGALMVTSHFDNWNAYYNEYDDEGITRPYVALLDLSYIDPKNIQQVSRGFGNEIFLYPDIAKQAILIKVYTVKAGERVDRKFDQLIPQSEEELKDLYNEVHE